MVERLVIPDQLEVEQELAVEHRWWTFGTRFNVAISQRIPVARMHDKEIEGVMLRWGLVPSSRKSHAAGKADSNIGMSDIESSEEYRSVWVYGQRCIVPVAGFYIWHRPEAGHRQPYYVRLVNRPVFGLAALWDRFVTDEDDVIEGCALLRVPANTLINGIDESVGQMPAILHRDGYQSWLTGRPARAKALLQSYPPERMVTHAVGPRVNFPEYDDPGLIRPI